MTLRPCLDCGGLSKHSRCPDHDRGAWHTEGTAHQRGYDHRWTKLSRRARKLQPFCTLCGTTDNLTTDHLASAWQRKAEGKVIRLADVRVLCQPCNVDAGTSRPGSRRATDGDKGSTGSRETAGEAKSALHTGVSP